MLYHPAVFRIQCLIARRKTFPRTFDRVRTSEDYRCCEQFAGMAATLGNEIYEPSRAYGARKFVVHTPGSYSTTRSERRSGQPSPARPSQARCDSSNCCLFDSLRGTRVDVARPANSGAELLVQGTSARSGRSRLLLPALARKCDDEGSPGDRRTTRIIDVQRAHHTQSICHLCPTCGLMWPSCKL